MIHIMLVVNDLEDVSSLFLGDVLTLLTRCWSTTSMNKVKARSWLVVFDRSPDTQMNIFGRSEARQANCWTLTRTM